jgi:vibriolysin
VIAQDAQLVLAPPMNSGRAMTKRKLIRAALAITVAGCQSGAPSGSDPKDLNDNSDVQDALRALPEASVLLYTPDGLLPTFIVGDLARIDAVQTDNWQQADTVLRPGLSPVLKAFRLTNADLSLRKINTDEFGDRHFRYTQTHKGLDVVGTDLVVHVDSRGGVFGINGTARGDISDDLGAVAISESTARIKIQTDSRYGGFIQTGTRQVYLQTPDGLMHRAYETVVEGVNAVGPQRDKVFVDQDTGEIVAVHPQIHYAENRAVYSANNGTSLPGTLRRSEGQAATTDVDVNAAYDNTGAAYEMYNHFFGRDSYNNAGAQLRSTVHYSTNYCNAFWNGSQMVYGDGSGSSCLPLARSVDVSGHELTHAVTENESNLIYSGESGGINEHMSDVFGNIAESYVDGGKNGTLPVSTDTFLVGEDILPPALRYMCDPATDGNSADVWSSGVGGIDVHYSSGVGNLAFCLVAKGGMHPRGKTTNNVPAIGLEKAARIWYKSNVDLLGPSSNYAAFRTASITAAQQLGYDQATQDAVGCAWAAVRVGTAPTSCGGTPPPPPPGDTVLQNGVALGGQSGTTGDLKFYKLTVPAGQTSLVFNTSGGSGDADMYVLFGSHPSTTSYSCRSIGSTTAETCTIANPAAGDWFVLEHAYTTYSGMTIRGTYSGGGGGGDPYVTSGVPVTGLSGTSGSNKYFRIAVQANRTLTVTIRPGSGSSGDADLYTRLGSRPTTSTYSCRPYLNGNTETCTVSTGAGGDYYIMLRGFTSYAGVTLTATSN